MYCSNNTISVFLYTIILSMVKMKMSKRGGRLVESWALGKYLKQCIESFGMTSDLCNQWNVFRIPCILKGITKWNSVRFKFQSENVKYNRISVDSLRFRKYFSVCNGILHRILNGSCIVSGTNCYARLGWSHQYRPANSNYDNGHVIA